MVFPDFALARRLERHEAWSSCAHARTQQALFPETGATCQAVAGVHAVFCGVKSPLSFVYNWGFQGPVAAADLDAVEAFYGSRQLPARIRVSPLTDPAALAALAARRYTVYDFMNVYVRPLAAGTSAPITAPGVRIAVATAEEASRWFALDGADGDWAEPDGLAFMTIRTTLKAGAQLYLAWVDGQPAAAGALEMHDGVAALMAGGTLPAYRQRGLHTALLHARLAAGLAAGCDLALVHTTPGTASQNNVLRAGFQLVYTTVTLASAGSA